MRHADGRLAFSATDLSLHLACRHLTSLRRAVALGRIEPPPPYDDPRADVLRQRGIEHERRLLEQFAAEGRTVEVVTAADAPFSDRDPAAAAARSRDAMRRGADVVYQGRLEDGDGRWSGYPDFLLRVGPSSIATGSRSSRTRSRSETGRRTRPPSSPTSTAGDLAVKSSHWTRMPVRST